MKQNFIIHNEAGRFRAIAVIQNLKLEDGAQFEFTLSPYKRDRSAEQRRLMWKHFHQMFERGMGAGSPDRIHDDCKRRILIPFISSLDVPKGPIKEWQEQIENARKMYRKGFRKEAMQLKEFLYSLVSTGWLNITQMSKYLELIETETMPLPKLEENYE